MMFGTRMLPNQGEYEFESRRVHSKIFAFAGETRTCYKRVGAVRSTIDTNPYKQNILVEA